ncbi:MAG: rhodanese-like domain-containing protein [Candidatus Bathyarchaeia archaeon]|jgi:hydroxyacylglutathione hydrolase
MKLKTVKSRGLAHNSYFLSSGGEAVVIDPRRDCEIYLELAKEECIKIRYILETHRNEDYVIGSLELQNMTEAEIGHSNALDFKYGDHKLADDDTLNAGDFKIKAAYTPGHTNESLCYAVYSSGNSLPLMVFTGDTLFAGSAGRTDLYGTQAQMEQAEKLYSSLHEKLLPLGDHVLVYPAHGEGSVCGHGINNQEPTTIGYERKTNPYLQLGKEDFIKKALKTKQVVPRYFRKMEELNLNGPPLLSELAYPKALMLETFEEEMPEHNMTVLDTRNHYSFAGAHIPDSLSMWLGGATVYPGWLLDPDQYILFILERASDIKEATAYLRRLGFDNLCGYLCGGMRTWLEAGRPFCSNGTITPKEVYDALGKGRFTLVDIREPSEWEEDGVIDGSELMVFPDIPEKAASLPKDKPIIIVCSVGERSSTAASLLQKQGFTDVRNMLGGMTAWKNLGYPIKTGA